MEKLLIIQAVPFELNSNSIVQYKLFTCLYKEINIKTIEQASCYNTLEHDEPPQ